MDINQIFDKGRRAHNNGDYETAIEAFEKVTHMAPHSFDAWWALASSCMLYGNQAELERLHGKGNSFKMRAADAFEKAASVDSSDSRASKALDIAKTLRAASEERRRLGLI